MRTLTRLLLAIALICAALAAHADPARFDIPGADRAIAFDAPPLSRREQRSNGGDYAFRANSNRFNISFFVETPREAGNTHEDVQRYYWSRASRNPMIDQASIVIAPSPNYVRVQYDIVADFGGTKVRQRHVNYFIAHAGKWVDVHISILSPTSEDEKVFSDFDKSLRLDS